MKALGQCVTIAEGGEEDAGEKMRVLFDVGLAKRYPRGDVMEWWYRAPKDAVKECKGPMSPSEVGRRCEGEEGSWGDELTEAKMSKFCNVRDWVVTPKLQPRGQYELMTKWKQEVKETERP